MQPQIPYTRDLVLVGGGHSHALVLKAWGMNPLPGARLTLINPGPTAPYTGMLPGHIAGHYGRAELDIDLMRLARFSGARIILGAVTGIDRKRQSVQIAGRPDVFYDALSINIGITSKLPEIKGFSEFGIAAKPLGAFADAWDATGRDPRVPAVIIGGGVGGVELALAMAHARGNQGQITLIDAKHALRGVSASARRRLISALRAANVELCEEMGVSEVAADHVLLQSGARIPSEFTLSAAGARPHAWLQSTGLALQEGFIKVTPTLQAENDPNVFAAGDCAEMTFAPRPKAGVFAVRQAPVLFHNLQASLRGAPLRSFKPQRSYLKLISLGGKAALAEKLGVSLAGPLLWRWKDRIDRTFMDKLNKLEPMRPAALPAVRASGDDSASDKPFCMGCGAKVGADVLSRVVSDLDAPTRADVVKASGDDAAVLKMNATVQVLTTDHLSALIDDPYFFARTAAHHALNDAFSMGADPQAVLTNITLPRMSDALQERTLGEVMAALQDVVTKAGAEIAGGHTTMGAEFTLGLTVTGLLSKPAITLDGAIPGDRLILTKPLGSGVIMAADMALAARGEWISNCLTLMDQSQGAAATILSDASAMTDVTGFGLAGHLSNICASSGVQARVFLADVPLMEGALSLAEQGIQSTLFAANTRSAAHVSAPSGGRADLLFDPQTSGGLLAAVSQNKAAKALKQLQSAGYRAAEIGVIQAGTPAVVFE